MRGLGARYQRLGRRTLIIDASAADPAPFDQRDPPTRRGQSRGERWSGLARA